MPYSVISSANRPVLFLLHWAGLEALVTAFGREIGQGVRVTLFDPGRVRTDMRAAAYPGEDRSRLYSAEAVGRAIANVLTDPQRPTGQRLHVDDYS